MKRRVGLGLAMAMWLAGCGGGKDDAADAGPDSGTDAGFSADSGSDAGQDARAGHDFDAAAPWYLCPDAGIPDSAIVVTAFDRADQYFGDEDRRTIRAEVGFPEAADWSRVGLWFELECPEDGFCDIWDRVGSVQMVENPDDDPSAWRALELLRHVTPYGMGMCQYVDVTPMAGLLSGERTLASFIDTWVGPGNPSGHGWRVTVRFVFYPGEDRGADQVINVWGNRTVTVGEVDAGATVDDQTGPVMVAIPADAKRVVAHLTATGHSFGNTGNCAEFCIMRQDLYVNGTLFSVIPFREDCDQNPVSPQGGTWQYGRNGWCPGAVAVGHRVDITEAVVPGSENEIDFDIRLENGDVYVNIDPVDWLPNEIVSLRLYVYL